jgi:hypothetical protein
MSKFDFSQLKKLDVNSSTIVEYPLTEFTCDEKPVLLLRSPSEGNKGYTNGILRLTGQSDGGRKRKLKIDASLMDDMREEDRALYPEFVIVGWRNIVDASGVDVEFSVDACKEFLEQLPNWIFDGLRLFAQDPESFVKQISADKGKNSQKG